MLLTSVLDACPARMLVADIDGTILAASPTMCTLLDLRGPELFTWSWWDLIASEDRQEVRAAWAQVSSGGAGSAPGPRRLVVRNGSLVAVQSSLTCGRNSDGVAQWMILTLDVPTPSSAPRAEPPARHVPADSYTAGYDPTGSGSAERSAHEYLTAVVEAQMDARVLVEPVRDPSGAVVDFVYAIANGPALEYLGKSREELIGHGMVELFPSRISSGLFDQYLRTLSTGEPLVFEKLHDTGAERWLQMRVARIFDSLSLTWRDVTETLLAQEALRQSEERFRLVAHNTRDVVVLADSSATIEWVSPSVTEELGWQPAEWIGQSLDPFVHPDDRAALGARRDAVFAGDPRTARMRVRACAGEHHWVESRSAPFRDAEGQIRGVLSSLRLIDDRVAYEESLRHEATHDRLTGLVTRPEAYRRLATQLPADRRTGTTTCLAFIDLDNLKKVNDGLGHLAGDELLRVVASRTSATLRQADVVARVGGDELLLILGGMNEVSDAVALMERVLETVNAPHRFDGHIIEPRMSIGLTALRPGEDIEGAVHRADEAMYRAKQAGGNRIEVAP